MQRPASESVEHTRRAVDNGATLADRRCNHPHAVAIDPGDGDLRALEEMLAHCPNCSRWKPGDGPIMATFEDGGDTASKASKDP